MTKAETHAAASLAAVFAMRLLGLFMIYPVFADYARYLNGATPELIGLSLGAYGLTQGLLQIPFGLVSDRIGRKSVIAGGLVLFGIGSAVAALSSSIYGVLLGRVLQGTGAVGSVILALVADLTSEGSRTQAMGVIGVTIGMSFVVAIVLGPLLAGAIALSGIFWVTAGLALVGIAIVFGVVPNPRHVVRHRDAEAVPALFARVLRNRELLRLDFAIFSLHAILTASFLALPTVLSASFALGSSRAWMLYLPVLAVSIVLMVPAIIVAEKQNRMKEVFLSALGVLAASLLALALAGGAMAVTVPALVAFFTGFNVMEAILPSLVTKTAPADAKGTATGIYSSSQFLGIFVGGALGGWALAYAGSPGVFGFAILLALIWFAVAVTMRKPGKYTNRLVRLGTAKQGDLGAIAHELRALPGVIEAVVEPEEGVAYLKIDRAHFDPASLAAIVKG